MGYEYLVQFLLVLILVFGSVAGWIVFTFAREKSFMRKLAFLDENPPEEQERKE